MKPTADSATGTASATPPVHVDELGTLDDDSAHALATYRQGDVLPDLHDIHVAGPDGAVIAVDCPLGVVVVSQTCDVVQPHRPGIQVARRIQLPPGDAQEARDGKRPRFAHLPQVGEQDFADLDVIGTVAKACIATYARWPGVTGPRQVRRFAGGVARKFSRFAFPDDVTPWLRPLEELISSKARKENSPEGKVLRAVVELRVEDANDWTGSPYDLTLSVIVKPGTLPTFTDDEHPALPDQLNTWLYREDGSLNRTPTEIAERLARTSESADIYWLWAALGEAWAAKCRPKTGTADRAEVSVASEVVPADEFPLSRVRRTEILDLDHLSPPFPL